MPELPLSFEAADGFVRSGALTSASHASLEVMIPGLCPSAVVRIARAGGEPLLAEAVHVHAERAVCTPLGPIGGVVPGARADSTLGKLGAFVGEALLGKAVDAWGRAPGIDGARVARAERSAIAISVRAPISRPLLTGVGAIDAFATLAHGQRVALVAGAGIGKTSLLRRIVASAHVNARVIALVGERGREAAQLLADLEGDESWNATTAVVATAERSPVERIAAVRTATAQAEALAETGRDVLLVVDSLTRVATAWREIALAAGEPPSHRGHPASLAGMLARLVERAGARASGSITAVYAVLVDGDDPREPVTDTVRSLVDGHIVLSRALADAGRFPAIDVLRSVSRTMDAVTTPEHRADAADVRRALAALDAATDLFAIGAYAPGGDHLLDAAVAMRLQFDRLIFDAGSPRRDAIAELGAVAAALRETLSATIGAV